MPPNAAELDTLLTQKNYLKLGNIFKSTNKGDDIALYLNWQQKKLMSGASAFINFAYIINLERFANALPGDAGLGLKKTSALIWLYTYTLILVDGVKCKDVSAPAHRKDQLLTVFPRVVKFMQSMPATEMVGVINVATRMEANTAATRADDDFLCRDGMDEMAAAMAKFGDKAMQEVPTPPGGFGKTMAIRTDPDYKPEFLPKDVWEPKQKEFRAAMPDILAKLTAGVASSK